MSKEIYCIVCFLFDKYLLFKCKLELFLLVKIYKYQFKKNERSGENDLIFNKRMKIEDFDDFEIDFDYVLVKIEVM